VFSNLTTGHPRMINNTQWIERRLSGGRLMLEHFSRGRHVGRSGVFGSRGVR
jgi:hypothetical protein